MALKIEGLNEVEVSTEVKVLKRVKDSAELKAQKKGAVGSV